MLSFNRTFMTTMLCLLAMLLTGVASSVRAATAQIEHHTLQTASDDFHHPLGTERTDCVESHQDVHVLEKGQQPHTSCTSSCLVKIPTNLLQDEQIQLPHCLALIDKALTPKAVLVIYKPYRPPIV
ncbi:hypothetical protein [Vibrio sp. Sgm 5]|uniref:hypothetical protein n=1 Tax=Vibrio sp. Sgm 5 TaxID=2994387 RepID=UPI0022491068|nr:hypothetical protein [Vibrio sp. Sgm 5]MCX2791463.1 hypothetical protein [Vibrio sp. Sgm 5]